MEFNSLECILILEQLTKSHIDFANYLSSLPKDQLQQKPNANSWNTLECLEHLNRYAAYYNPEFEKKMKASSLPSTTTFKSGKLGYKFAQDMLPKEGMKTINTFKSKNPINTNLITSDVITCFINDQNKLLELLELAKTKSLEKIKIQTTIPLLKLRLGDTLRFIIHHNERHIVQIKNILNPDKK